MATFPGLPDEDGQSTVIHGDDLANVLLGRGGDDKIRALGGDDKLYGGVGRDTLIGGTGNDLLKGDTNGKGGFADLFVFGKNSGRDIITDFDVEKDVLQIAKGLNGINKARDVLDHAKQVGKDVVIDLGGGNKITLKKVNLDDLKKNPGDHFDVNKNISS